MKTKLLTTAIILVLLNTLTFAQELNGPTSWDTIGDTFSQPNVHMQIGKNKLDWYGSGDVNNDEVINSADLDAMNNGVKNDRSDIDGDGNSSTSNDKAVLQDYLNGGRNYLPGHWNSLETKEEKRSWKNKMFAIDDIVSYFYDSNGNLKDPNGIHPVCRNYNHQREIDFYGVSNIDEFIQEQEDGGEITYDKTNNARFNIPLQHFSTINTSGSPHGVTGVLVGDDPLNFNDWDFIASDYRGHRITYPGEFAMDGNEYARMVKTAYVKDELEGGNYFNFIQNFLNFETKNNEGILKDYWAGENGLLLENPNNFTIDVVDPNDVTLNYESNLDVSPNNTGTPQVNVSNGLEYTLTHTDGNHYDENSSYPNIEYSFDRTWKGTSTNKNDVTKTDTEVQRITVSDTEKPYGVIPNDINLTKEQVDQNGGLSRVITGEVSGVSDNSNLSVDKSVSYNLLSENSEKQVYEAYHTLVDKFNNSKVLGPQKINVLKAKVNVGQLEDIVVNAKKGQDLSPEVLESEGHHAEPEVTTANTTSGYTLNYSDSEKSNSTVYPWADKDITRTYIANLDDASDADTMKYVVKVRDLERPVIGDLEKITITKDDSLHPSATGYPKITDNVAVKDTAIWYELDSEDEVNKYYKAMAKVTDVFNNDTTYHYQDVVVDKIVGVEDEGFVPNKYELKQNYPNPFNPTTTISFTVPVPQTFLSANPNNAQNQNFSQTGKSVLRKTVPRTFLSATTQTTSQNVSLVVYNLLGKKVATLVDETKPAGRYSVTFNAEHLPSGVYLYRFISGKFTETKQMLLLK